MVQWQPSIKEMPRGTTRFGCDVGDCFHVLSLCCCVSYDFNIKMMFDSYLPPVVCRSAQVVSYLYLFTYSDDKHDVTLRVILLVFYKIFLGFVFLIFLVFCVVLC